MTTLSNPVELRRRGLEVLIRELGFVDAMRFMLQFETGQGDYTRDREQMLPKWTMDEMLREAERLVPPSQ